MTEKIISSSHGGFDCFEGVNFKDHHRAGDPVMTPDRGFTKQLKALDPTLEVLWDWIGERWSIWCFPKEDGKDPYHILTVGGFGKSYRELGQDILLQLQECIHFQLNPDKLLDYIEEHNNQIRRRKAKDFSAKVQAMARETFNYSHDVLQISVPRTLTIGEALKSG